MFITPFYNPKKSYEENFEQGPFGAFADKKVEENEGKPQFDFFGYKVFSPFGIAAGPLINGKFVQAALDKGFDIVTYKTVRSEKYPCHPWPNVLFVKVPEGVILGKNNTKLVANNDFQEPLSITNSFGVPSFDPDFWQKDISRVVKNLHKGQVLIGAFQGTKKVGQSAEEYIDDFRVVSKMLKKTGVKIMEVNLSCPNEGTNDLLCYDVARSVQVVKVIKKEIGNIPLIVKISYFKNDEFLINFIKEMGVLAQGISAINTIGAEVVDEKGEQALPGEERLISGICGKAIKWAGLDMTRRLKKLRAKLGYSYTIIGVGGISTPKDFLEYRKAGADIVMSATGAMWNPYLAKEVKEKLK